MAALIALHAAVLLFGLAGLFGKALSVNPLTIVAGRTFFATMTLVAYLLSVKKRPWPEPQKGITGLIVAGVVLALHWCAFFQAISISTVAVGLLGYAAFPLFVTFLEPFCFNEKQQGSDLLASTAIMIGLIAVAWPVDFTTDRTIGVLWGLLSGFLFAVLSLLNRKLVQYYPLL